ncbi:tail fiber assembly protein [Pseudomonas aeruginosa]|nr:tail fiber assembly protein [Pseudomonas aeruginosa]MDI3811456.1 tail fiber assembly protein [Pseudomonas aeruginosa]
MKPVFPDSELHPLVKWDMIRDARDAELAESDYAAMPDYPFTTEQRSKVKAYRQALRDIPSQGDDPDAVVWPEKPNFLK